LGHAIGSRNCVRRAVPSDVETTSETGTETGGHRAAVIVNERVTMEPVVIVP